MKQKPLLFVVTAVLALSSMPSFAATWVPANSGAQTWNVSGNWTDGIPDIMPEKGLIGSTTLANRLSNGATYTITQDIASLNIGTLSVELVGSPSAFSAGGVSGNIGQNSLTVAAGANFRVGDVITGTGITVANTTVTDVTGNVLTLSNNFSVQAAGNYNPQNNATTVNLSGNAITLGNATTASSFYLRQALTGNTTNTINVSANVVMNSTGAGLPTSLNIVSQGTTPTANGVNFTGAYSGAGNVTLLSDTSLNNSLNSQSGVWTGNTFSSLSAFSNSMGTATYIVSGGLNNSIIRISDTAPATVTNLITDNGSAFNGVVTSGAGSAGISLIDTNTVTFSNIEIGTTTGNAYVKLGRTGTGIATYKITDPDWSPNANIQMDNANLDLANTSGVQTFYGAIIPRTSNGTLNRSGVGGTTILTQSTGLPGTVTISGGTLLVNNPSNTTNNVTSGTITTTSGSRQIAIASTAGLVLGQFVSGTGVASNSYITSIDNGNNTFVVSYQSTASATVAGTFGNNSGTGTGSVNVTGGTLGGSGLIGPCGTSKITVSSGAFISPGGNGTAETIGTLIINGVSTSTTGLLTMNTGANFNFQLGTGSSSDKLDFWNFTTGDLLRATTAVDLTLDPSVTSGTITFNLFNFYTDYGQTLSASTFAGSGADVLALGSLSGNIQSAAFNYSTPGQINLVVTAVPESATWAFLATGLTVVVTLRRRRHEYDCFPLEG